MNLKDISFKTALRIAKEVSGLTLEDISERTGISLSQLQRYFSEEDYYPSPPKIVAISKAMNTKLLAHWFMAQVEDIENSTFRGYSEVVENIDRVTREIVKALEDGIVNEMERQRILTAAENAYKSLEALINALQKGGE